MRKNTSFACLGLLLLAAGCSRQTEARPLESTGEIPPQKPAVVEAGSISTPVFLPERENSVSPAIKPASEQPFANAARTGEKGEGIAFPPDRGGKLVEHLVRPADEAPPPWASKPRCPSGPAFLEKPSVSSKAFAATPPRLALPKRTPIRPHPLQEGMPLYGQRSEPRLPQEILFPTTPLLHWASPDADAPAPLPIFAQRQPDRASLADPTVEFSTAAALAGIIPMRTTLAPFIRLNLPDPFEHSHAVRLGTPPPEDPTPR